MYSWVQEANFFLLSFFISKPHAIPRDQASLSSFFTGMAEAIAFRARRKLMAVVSFLRWPPISALPWVLSRFAIDSDKQKGVGRRRFRREPPFAVKD
jgi:hypothetical protein